MSINSQIIRKTKGFTLLETMIALVIFSVGLVGLAGLQATALRDNGRSIYRMQANFLAYDVLDRMRANRDEAVNGTYDIGLGPIPTSSLCNGTSSNCNQAAVANADRREWKTSLRDLPFGDGSIARAVIGGQTQFIITVTWDDTRSGAANTTVTVRAEL